MTWLILFMFGLAIGSFLNVIAVRYDGERFLLNQGTLGGRSRCPHCGKTLRWFELIPLASWIMLGGHCARCHAGIDAQYPIVELLSGFIFALVPYRVMELTGTSGGAFVAIAILWVVVFEALLLMSLIDIRLGIIPDELNGFLVILGIFGGIFTMGFLGALNVSFIGPYASLFGLQESFWVSHLAAAVFGAAFFGALIAITRGRGMGMGDLKLAVPLGLLFGWPDILFVVAFASVIGAAVGVVLVILGRRKMKGTVPFGPFLALGALTVFFFAAPLVQWYLSAVGLG